MKEQSPIIFEGVEDVYNEDGNLVGHAFIPTPEHRAAMQRHLIPFILRKPEDERWMIRKVVTQAGKDYIQYTPAPVGYKVQAGETLVSLKPRLTTEDSEPTISEVTIPSTSVPSTFKTKY